MRFQVFERIESVWDSPSEQTTNEDDISELQKRVSGIPGTEPQQSDKLKLYSNFWSRGVIKSSDSRFLVLNEISPWNPIFLRGNSSQGSRV